MSKISQAQSPKDLRTCGVSSNGEWIACDSPTSPVEWYHWSCVGVTEEPVGEWICPRCSFGTQAGVRKAVSGNRKSRRNARVVYETTEASVFENIVNESRAVVLASMDAAKVGEGVGRLEEEGKGAEEGEESVEEVLVRKMWARVEKERGERGEPRDQSSYGVVKHSGEREDDEDVVDISGRIRRGVIRGVFPISAKQSTLKRPGG